MESSVPRERLMLALAQKAALGLSLAQGPRAMLLGCFSVGPKNVTLCCPSREWICGSGWKGWGRERGWS